MQYGVLAALGLDPSAGLYNVVVTRPFGNVAPVAETPVSPALLPDTAVKNCGGINGLIVVLAVIIGGLLGGIIAALLAVRTFR